MHVVDDNKTAEYVTRMLFLTDGGNMSHKVALQCHPHSISDHGRVPMHRAMYMRHIQLDGECAEVIICVQNNPADLCRHQYAQPPASVDLSAEHTCAQFRLEQGMSCGEFF